MTLKNPELILLAALLASPPAAALDTDRTQPLKIVADSALLDDKAGIATYSGNVVLTQGSLKINAGNLRIQTAQGKVDIVTADGQPASFTQTPAPDQPPVVATARNIEYRVKEQLLILKREASIVQNENVFKGEEIRYEIQSQRLKAVGQPGSNTPGETGKQRVEMILPSAAELAPATPNNPQGKAP